MHVNQIIPLELKERVCIHCAKKEGDEDPMTYLIAEAQKGKTTETIRQAVFRRDVILSTEYDYYKAAGMKHVTEAKPTEICYMGVRDIIRPGQIDLLKNAKSGKVHLCVDNAKEILEELLSMRFEVPIKIDFMSLEA